ncbi:hypothetical protein EJB05_54869 [Eragrostis curvula]|uniref:Major facilitator superfamily (MFS) profile domain-containing protein n=1 Tax=Eragrostis curvula TaxID=38414 RepID=A0A5J9SL83_9POAL|nr:hypothetical protein EJB05_54869 [Eragrostis curvula]
MAGAEACTYTTDEALSRLGFGRFQAMLLVVLGTGWIAEAMEIMLQSFVGPSVKAEWRVSAEEEGLVTSVVFVGMLLGACAGGLGSDRFGRRLGFLFTTLVTGISGFLCAFSPNYASLITLRFVVGLGLGASHVLPTWFLESVAAETRGSWMAAFSSFFTLGTILEALLAWAVMPILGWRWLLGLSSLPCFILLIFSGLIPESPRYLCSRGRTSDAMLVLERIARINNRSLPPGILTSDLKRRVDHKIGASVTTLLLMPEDNHRIDDNTSSKSDGINEFRALWSHELIRSTLLLWLVYFSIFFAYYGIVLLVSEVSNGNRSCASVGPHLTQPKDSNLYINVLVTSFADLPNIMSQHWSWSSQFHRSDWKRNRSTHDYYIARELPLERSGVCDCIATLPCRSRMCLLPSRNQRSRHVLRFMTRS